MQVCDHCLKEIDSRATICPYCRTAVAADSGSSLMIFVYMGLLTLVADYFQTYGLLEGLKRIFGFD